VVEEGVEKMDFFVYLSRGSGQVCGKPWRAPSERGRLSAQELERFLSSRPQARGRYLEILKIVAKGEGMRWSEIKTGLEARERESIAGNVFNGLLKSREE
jgi:hypothetical protein